MKKKESPVERREMDMNTLSPDMLNHRLCFIISDVTGYCKPSLADWYLWYCDLETTRFEKWKKNLVVYNNPGKGKEKCEKKRGFWVRMWQKVVKLQCKVKGNDRVTE